MYLIAKFEACGRRFLRRLLAVTDFVQEVAAAVGFKDQDHFSGRFKEFFRYSSKMLRQRMSMRR